MAVTWGSTANAGNSAGHQSLHEAETHLAQRWTPMTGPVQRSREDDEQDETAKEPEPKELGPAVREQTVKVTLAEFPKSAGNARKSQVDGTSRGYIGVTIQAVSEDLKKAVSLATTDGALVLRAASNSPAAQFGVLPGDIAISVDGRKIRTYADFARTISSYRAGDSVDITVLRVGVGPEDLRDRLMAEADAGNTAAMFVFANWSSAPTIIKTDEQNAARFAREAAEANHVQAMRLWGNMLVIGYGTTADPARGTDWYRRAAELGNVEAMESLSGAYEAGNGVKMDKLEALNWARKAAEQGNANSMSRIARFYHFGTGIGRNLRVAAEWYAKAVEGNETLAMNNLAVLYDAGTGVKKNDAKATELYRRAIRLGNTTAMVNLAAKHDVGTASVRRDRDEAARLVYTGLRAADPVVIKRMKTEGNRWSVAFRKKLQQRLKQDGSYTGPIDGQLGPGFRRAVDQLASARRKK